MDAVASILRKCNRAKLLLKPSSSAFSSLSSFSYPYSPEVERDGEDRKSSSTANISDAWSVEPIQQRLGLKPPEAAITRPKGETKAKAKRRSLQDCGPQLKIAIARVRATLMRQTDDFRNFCEDAKNFGQTVGAYNEYHRRIRESVPAVGAPVPPAQPNPYLMDFNLRQIKRYKREFIERVMEVRALAEFYANLYAESFGMLEDVADKERVAPQPRINAHREDIMVLQTTLRDVWNEATKIEEYLIELQTAGSDK